MKKQSKLRSRVIPAIFIIVISLLALCIGYGWPFRILFLMVCGLAWIELDSLVYHKTASVSRKTASMRRWTGQLLLVCGAMYMFLATQTDIVLLLACVWGADAAGWLFGRMFGHRLFKKVPFSNSPNKTVEGSIAQVVAPLLIFIILRGVCLLIGQPICGIFVDANEVYFVSVGALALGGDLFGSCIKRAFWVKNSSDQAAQKYPFFGKIKEFLGDHGGVFDRIDSIVFTGTILFLGWTCMLCVRSLFYIL